MGNNLEEEVPVLVRETSSLASPLAERESHDYDEDEDFEESYFTSSCSCSCFNFNGSIFSKRNNVNGSNRYTLLQEEKQYYRSFREKVKKLKELSEILAGPKWKNFIRRFGGHSSKKRRLTGQYDPQSYALNFDDGIDRETDVTYPDFFARYASAPLPVAQS